MYESTKDLLKQRENEIAEKEEIQRGELDSVATFSLGASADSGGLLSLL